MLDATLQLHISMDYTESTVFNIIFKWCCKSILPTELCCTATVTKGSYSIWWHRRDNFLCIGYSFNKQGLLQAKLSQILVHDPYISSSEKSI